MSVRAILTWPDPRLSQPCEPVRDIAGIKALVTDMFETMYAAPGRGLAAPQVGVLARVFVMDARWKDGEMTPLACINPRVVSASDETAVADEGCLSVPGVTAQVTRPARVVLVYTSLSGEEERAELTGFAARCAQHELDHLDGVMHFDRLGSVARTDLIETYEAAR